MNPIENDKEALCSGCVYFPGNLPAHAYAKEDYDLLQSKACSYDLIPGGPVCQQTRKTSCSIVDLTQANNQNS